MALNVHFEKRDARIPELVYQSAPLNKPTTTAINAVKATNARGMEGHVAMELRWHSHCSYRAVIRVDGWCRWAIRHHHRMLKVELILPRTRKGKGRCLERRERERDVTALWASPCFQERERRQASHSRPRQAHTATCRHRGDHACSAGARLYGRADVDRQGHHTLL